MQIIFRFNSLVKVIGFLFIFEQCIGDWVDRMQSNRTIGIQGTRKERMEEKRKNIELKIIEHIKRRTNDEQ